MLSIMSTESSAVDQSLHADMIPVSQQFTVAHYSFDYLARV